MFRRAIRYAAAALVIAALLCVHSYAEKAVVTPSKGLNMRSGPGTDYRVITTLPYNTEVNVTGSSGSWYSVSYAGMSGYVSSSYLRFVSDGSGASGPSSSPSIFSGGSSAAGTQGIFIGSGKEGTGTSPSIFSSSTSQGTVQTADPYTVTSSSQSTYPATITGDYVRLRTGPSVSYTIITMIRKGSVITVTGTYGEWTKCTYNGENGFVSSQYVSQRQTVQQSSTSAANQQTLSPSIFSTQGQAQTQVQTQPQTQVQTQPQTQVQEQPAASAQQGYTVTPMTQRLGYITGNNVRFRSGPSTDYDIIGEFQYGDSVYITGKSGEWVAAAADGKSGFVSGRYVSEGVYSPPAAQPAETRTEQPAGSSGESQIQQQEQTQLQLPEPSEEQVQPEEQLQQEEQTQVYTAVNGDEVAQFALTLKGSRYNYGGTSPEEGFDCSGFVWYVYKHFGITLNRIAADQAKNGVHVETDDLKPGDVLCFYSGNSYIGHSGIYIGNGQFIHAATSTTGVVVTDLSGNYSARGYEARRIIT